jgi:polar amino acid transport system permease protein
MSWQSLQGIALYLASGTAVTLALAAGAVLVAGALGLVIAVVRLYAWLPLRWSTAFLTVVIKGVPLLILLIGAYVILPYFGIDVPPAAVAIFTIGIYFSAYASEIYRAAIQSIPAAQWDAGRSLGFRPWQLFVVVVLPQTARFCAAPLIGIFIMTVKSTSLVSAIGAWELLSAGRETAERTFLVLPIYLIVAAIYFVICFGLSRLSKRVEKAFTHA